MSGGQDYLLLDEDETLPRELPGTLGCFRFTGATRRTSPLGPVTRVMRLRLCAGNPPPRELVVMGRRYARLLDRFYLPRLPNPAVSTVLFDMAADTYEQLVDTAHNVLNIVRLLRTALDGLPRRGRLRFLDFGCGTGLSVQALAALGQKQSSRIDMLGMDCSPRMLSLASRKALRTISFRDWQALPNNTFDAIIASYVFHCGLEDEELAILSCQLKGRGVLIGNYHHATEEGMAHLIRQAEANGLRFVSICETAAPEKNPVVVFAGG